MRISLRCLPPLTLLFAIAAGACSGSSHFDPILPTDAATGSSTSLDGGDAGNPGDANSTGATDATAADGLSSADASHSLNVLFVGNSYTFVNDLPGTVKSLVVTVPGMSSATVDSTTVGGATLQQLIGTTDVLTKIRSRTFTHVVLQEQSVTPCLDPTGYVNAATALASEARAAGATVLLYGTWPRRAGDSVYTQSWSGGNPAALEACLEAGFAKAVAATGATLVDVGEAWMRALAARPTLPLYQADGSHPQPDGTFLAAVLFTHALTGVPAASLTSHPAGVTDADAAFLEAIADGH